MAYRFAGFLASSDTEFFVEQALPPDAIFRRITTPIRGFGVAFASVDWKSPSVDEIYKIASEMGFTQARSWLYIDYDTWAGSVDSVYALGVQQGVKFGPFEDSNEETVNATFLDAMARIGVAAKDAFRFTPFSRGFWEA